MYTQSQTDEMDKFEYTIVLNSWVNLDQFWDLENYKVTKLEFT